MSTAKRFEELVAWQKARELANAVYGLSKTAPLSRDFGLRDQLQRAAVSVMSNIAEGFERDTIPDFIHFLSIAKGSAGEVRSHLYVAADQKLISEDQLAPLLLLSRHCSSVISKLVSYLRTRAEPRRRTP